MKQKNTRTFLAVAIGLLAVIFSACESSDETTKNAFYAGEIHPDSVNVITFNPVLANAIKDESAIYDSVFTDTIHIDVDNDQKNDFALIYDEGFWKHNGTYIYHKYNDFWLEVLNDNIDIPIFVDEGIPFIGILQEGQSINSSLNWSQARKGLIFRGEYSGSSFRTYGCLEGCNYIPFRNRKDSIPKYAWINIKSSYFSSSYSTIIRVSILKLGIEK